MTCNFQYLAPAPEPLYPSWGTFNHFWTQVISCAAQVSSGNTLTRILHWTKIGNVSPHQIHPLTLNTSPYTTLKLQKSQNRQNFRFSGWVARNGHTFHISTSSALPSTFPILHILNIKTAKILMFSIFLPLFSFQLPGSDHTSAQKISKPLKFFPEFNFASHAHYRVFPLWQQYTSRNYLTFTIFCYPTHSHTFPRIEDVIYSPLDVPGPLPELGIFSQTSLPVRIL